MPELLVALLSPLRGLGAARAADDLGQLAHVLQRVVQINDLRGTVKVHLSDVPNPRCAVEQRLWAKTPVGGLARYENDYYHQVSTDVEHVAGNPWILCTLWLAQYRIATADTLEKLESSLDIMEWALARALPSGVMAEQVNPYTNQPLSVSPLTWSHATFVTCVMEYLRRLEKLVVCDNCGRSMFRMDRHGREVIPDYLCDHSPALSGEALSPLS